MFFRRPHQSVAFTPFTSQMRWIQFLVLICLSFSVDGISTAEIHSLRQETVDLFYHGYDNYMRHAFPEDELRPISCGPLVRDRVNPAHIEVNDVLGNYSLTLIDSLSTLAILASSPPQGQRRSRSLRDFQEGVALLVHYYGDGTNGTSGQGKRARGFDLDSKVQVFETTIRGVGGLLSAHQFAVGQLPIRGYSPTSRTKNGRQGISWPNGFFYDGQLLRLAYDLAERLLPAFHTPTGLPYPRVNLRHGIPFYANSPLNNDAEHGQCSKSAPKEPEITETCSAGAGSLVLEFSTLSRLTGDMRFEKAAKAAFWAVWDRRSSIGLLGSGIDAESGQWVSPYTGIGAGIDSFFEYAFKSHILLSGLPFEPERAGYDSSDAFLEAWHDAHEGIKRHVYRGAAHQHPHYIQVDLYTGAMRAFWIDSLSAYYPGLLALAGELEEAIETHLLYAALWTRYSALPERWSTATGNIEQGLRWWGGRPEFIESTWYLYRATSDPFYLHVGEMALRDIKRRCWTKCGWAGLQDVRTGEKSDRMESFFLGETAKYLFLLFDESHPLNTWDAPFVFTTEGHPLVIPRTPNSERPPAAQERSQRKREFDRSFGGTCPLPPTPVPFSISATAARPDIFHAANLARLHLMPNMDTLESPLQEFNADHPSISISDLQSPSNYTYYPWTLPPELVPSNGISSKLAGRTTFDLSFPTLPESVLNFGSVQRVEDGIKINSMSNLRLGMIMEPYNEEPGFPMQQPNEYRIFSVSNVPLGRDEKVFMPRELVASFNPVDPYFTRIRDMVSVDLLVDTTSLPLEDVTPDHDTPDELDRNLTALTGFLDIADIVSEDTEFDIPADTPPTKLSSLIANIQKFLTAPTAPSSRKMENPFRYRHKLYATLPTGLGAAPLPNVEDSSAVTGEAKDLPWGKVYITGQLCDERLPVEAAKTHQILVIRRGGCSFSDKLQNIPAFPPHAMAIQLVVIVSFPEQDIRGPQGDETRDRKWAQNLVDKSNLAPRPLSQPLLDVQQMTPSGIPRPNPLPLILVDGGEDTIGLFRRANGVGIRRHWHYMTQGLKIQNLVVL